MTEFEFERGELLTNLTLLEDHAQKFQCPYCMEKHSSKIIGYAEEISQGGESVNDMEKLARDARKWRRKIQGAKNHSHNDIHTEHSVSDIHAECESVHGSDKRAVAKCVKKLK